MSFQVIAVRALHATASQMGVLTAFETVPYLVLGLFIGVLVDHTSNRRLLIGSDLARLVVLVGASYLAVSGRINIQIMWAVVCVISTFNLVFDAALGAYVPKVLARSQWLRANSRLSATQSGSEVAGPGLAGYMLQAISAPAVMLIDGVTYGVSAMCILVGKPNQPGGVSGGRELDKNPIVPPEVRMNVWLSMRQGASFVFRHRILRIFAIWTAVWNFSWSAVLAVFVLYATHILMMSPGSIGLAVAVGGIGGILGSSMAGRLAKRWSRGRVLVFAPLIGASGGALLFAARGARALIVVADAMLFYSLGEGAFGVNIQTCRQELTPANLMGRMDTTMRVCFRGMASLGALAGGLVGSKFGLRAAILAGVCGLFVTVVGLYCSGLADLVGDAND